MPGVELTREELDRLFGPNAKAGPEVHDHATCPCCGGQSPDLPYSQVLVEPSGETVPERKPLTDEEREELFRRIRGGG